MTDNYEDVFFDRKGEFHVFARVHVKHVETV